MENKTLEIYHRGLREGTSLPNSFENLLNAKKGDTLEMDVFLLKDGTLAMAHNKDLGISQKEVEEMGIGEFQALDQPNSQTKEAQRGTKMPLLEEILGIAYDRGLKIQLELKAGSVEQIELLADSVVDKMLELRQTAFTENPDFLAGLSFFSMSVEGMEHLAERLRSEGLDNETYLSWPSSEKYAEEMEISKTSIERAQGLSGDLDWFEKGIMVSKGIGCTGVSIHAENLIKNPKYVNMAHDLGLKILAGGVVNKAEDAQSLRELGVERLMSENLK